MNNSIYSDIVVNDDTIRVYNIQIKLFFRKKDLDYIISEKKK